MVNTAIIGGRGYLGRELVRLLIDHPLVDEVTPISQSADGEPYGRYVPSLRHADLTFADDSAAQAADVIFTATPKDAAAAYVEVAEETGATVIDLSRDHRIQGIKDEGPWHYGLADVDPPAKGTKRVANPGCYPTASLLATLPAVQNNLSRPGPIIIDGKSGVSGAGVTPRADLHFPAMNGSTRAYKVEGHDHQEEMLAACTRAGGMGGLRFTPHLVPQSRGLLATAYVPIEDGVTQDDADAAYRGTYGDATFVRLVEEPDTAVVAMSNFTDIAVHVDTENRLLVARGAIDNLVKGGAGQAVQNLNHCMGWAPETGLKHTGGGI